MLLIFLLISTLYLLIILWFSESLNNTFSSNKINFTNYTKPFVSIIIAAHNEEKNIPNLLNSLFNQSYNFECYEIIIINDRSDDNTKNIISNYKNHNVKLINIDKTPLGWSNKKWALNSGIKQAQGEIILQTDADCIPNEFWIETMVNAFAENNVGFIFGPSPLYSKNNIENILQLENNAQDSISAAALQKNIILSCTGRNLGFLKNKFLDINGYDTTEHIISGDDDLLMHKMNKYTDYKIKFVFDHKASVFSNPPNSINQFIKQRLRFASKGLFYYEWKTDISLRIFLPFLYISNLIICVSLILFTSSAYYIYLIPWFIKSIGDFYLTYNYCNKIDQNWNILDCLILSIVHPFYIVVFGSLGPFIKVKWK